MNEQSEPPITTTYYRQVLASYPTGVAIVTALTADGDPVGMVVGTFTSVSLDPLLVAYMPAKSSASYASLRGIERFCINVLAEDQGDLCHQFTARGGDKYAGVAWTPAPSGGAPVLSGVAAWIDCAYSRTVDAGDHDIVLAHVVDLGAEPGRRPLLFCHGSYGAFAPGSVPAG